MVLAAFLVAGPGEAIADVKLPKGVGPVGQDVAGLRVVRGGVVAVPLVATAPGVSGSLEYSIFEEPKFGTLGEITIRDGVPGARVLYRPSEGTAATVDTFKFRARAPGGRYSSPATVTIVIVTPRPMLEIPERLDFGKVPMLDRAVREFTVVNRGDGAFNGEFRLPAPFRLETPGDGKVSVPAGGEGRVTISYSPQGKDGKDRFGWVLQENNPRGQILLLGERFAPFQADRGQILLEFDGESSERRSSLQVSNPGGEPIALTVVAPERLRVDPRQLRIDPGAVAELAVSLPATDVLEFSTTVELRGLYHSEKIELLAPAVPAQVTLSEPGTREIQFDGDYGKNVSGELKIKNSGGKKAFVSASVNPPFYILEGQGGQVLEPGGEFTYHLELRPDRVGLVSEVLKVEGGDRPILVPLSGHIVLPPGMEAPEPRREYPLNPAGDGGVTRRSIPTSYLVVGKAETERRTSDSVPVVEGVKFVSGDKRTLVFGWPQPAGGNWDYVVETEVHRIHEETKLPHPLWIELDSKYATVTKKGARAEAKIVGLEPGGKYTFRILTRAPDGSFSPASERLVFVTAMSTELAGWFRPWMVAVLIVVGVGIYALLQRRRYLRELYGS